MEKVYSDILYTREQGQGAYNYVITFIDAATRYVWHLNLPSRDMAFEAFVVWLPVAERESGEKLKSFQSNGGGEYQSQRFRRGTCLVGAEVTMGAGGTGGAAAAEPRGARTRGTGAAGTGGVGGARAGGPTEPGGAGAGGARAVGAGAGGAGAGGARAGGAGAVDPGVGSTGAEGAGAGGAGVVDIGAGGAGGAPASPLPAPFPYTEQTGGLTECREPTSRPASPTHRVPRLRPPPVPGTHAMTLRPSSVPLCIPLLPPPESSLPAVPDPKSDCARAASPTVSRLLATSVTDPSFQSTAVDPLPGTMPVEVAGDSGAAWGAACGGVEPGGAEPGGAESEGVGSGGAEPGGLEPGGAEPEGVEPRGAESRGTASAGGPARASRRLSPRPEPLSLQQLREWFAQRTRLRSGATGAGDPAAGDTGGGGDGVTAGAGGTGGAAAAGPGGARTRGTGAAETGSVGSAGAGDPTEPGAGGAGGTGTGGAGGAGAGVAGAVGAGAGGTGTGGVGAGGARAVDPGAGGAGAGGAVSGGTGAGGTVRPRPYFVPLLQPVLGVSSSTGLTPPLLCPPPDQSQPPLHPASPLPAPSPYAEQTGGLTERREPVSRPDSPFRIGRRVPRLRPPPVPGTHAMALRPSSVPLRVPLPPPPESSLPAVPDPESDLARATSPTVSPLLTTVVTDPSFWSTDVSALVAELVEFTAACRLDYASALVVESESASPPSVGGECALGTDVLEDRQEDFECLAAAVPRFASMLLAPDGDPGAPDIPTARSYTKAITDPYSSQWQAAMDTEMASWKSTCTYVDAVPPSRANIVDGMWIFRVKRPPGSPPAFKARYVARGFTPRAAPSGPLAAPAALLAAPCGPFTSPCCYLPSALRCPTSPRSTCCATMASLRELGFDHEGRPLQFDMQLYLLSDSMDSVLLFDHTSGVAPAPPATAGSVTRSQWLTRDAAACLAIRNHLTLAECAHFRQHRTAQALYDAVVARYSLPATAALGRLLLPYLFPELSAFATVEDLISHLHTSDARYRAAAPADFLDRNQPPMFITLYFVVTRLPYSLRSVRDHFLSLDPTSLTIDLLKQHLLAAETSAVAIGAARGTPRTPFFEGCSPSPLAPSYTSAAAVDVSSAEDIGAASASEQRHSSKGKGGRGGGGGSGSGGGGSSGGPVVARSSTVLPCPAVPSSSLSGLHLP
ncbi:unnamed protein product [Closterium sp. NIES-54]